MAANDWTDGDYWIPRELTTTPEARPDEQLDAIEAAIRSYYRSLDGHRHAAMAVRRRVREAVERALSRP